MKKLAIVTTHPIQYNAPLFRLMAGNDRVQIKVFYTWEQSQHGAKFDPGFGKHIEWDIPVLEGYEYCFVKNTASNPGTHHFNGIVNPGLVKEIENWGPDAILVFGWSFNSHLKCLRYFHGKIRILFRGDSTLLDEKPGLRKWVRRLFLKWVYRHVDCALYVGTNNKNYFLKHGIPEGCLFFAPHAVDNDRFAEPDEAYIREAGIWRSQLGIGPDDLVLLFAGKLEPKKNPFFLLDLVKTIHSPKFKVLIIGNGVLENKLKELAAGDPRILFLDFQNQQKMPVVYRLADLFILPSTGPDETWGLAINEAMACRRALILSSKVGGAVDLVHDGENGLIFNLKDPGKCVAFITRLLKDREALGNMQHYSYELVQRYSFDHILKAVETAMENK
jgi:glycosyltransferase involved in cell wall biosynthesis